MHEKLLRSFLNARHNQGGRPFGGLQCVCIVAFLFAAIFLLMDVIEFESILDSGVNERMQRKVEGSGPAQNDSNTLLSNVSDHLEDYSLPNKLSDDERQFLERVVQASPLKWLPPSLLVTNATSDDDFHRIIDMRKQWYGVYSKLAESDSYELSLLSFFLTPLLTEARFVLSPLHGISEDEFEHGIWERPCGENILRSDYLEWWIEVAPQLHWSGDERVRCEFPRMLASLHTEPPNNCQQQFVVQCPLPSSYARAVTAYMQSERGHGGIDALNVSTLLERGAAPLTLSLHVTNRNPAVRHSNYHNIPLYQQRWPSLELTATHTPLLGRDGVASDHVRADSFVVCTPYNADINSVVEFWAWFGYHRLQGAAHFIMYDTSRPGSHLLAGRLNLYAFVNALERVGLLTLVPWFSTFDTQRWAIGLEDPLYTDCVQRHQSSAAWVTNVHMDEFLLPGDKHATVGAMLASQPLSVDSVRVYEYQFVRSTSSTPVLSPLNAALARSRNWSHLRDALARGDLLEPSLPWKYVDLRVDKARFKGELSLAHRLVEQYDENADRRAIPPAEYERVVAFLHFLNISEPTVSRGDSNRKRLVLKPEAVRVLDEAEEAAAAVRWNETRCERFGNASALARSLVIVGEQPFMPILRPARFAYMAAHEGTPLTTRQAVWRAADPRGEVRLAHFSIGYLRQFNASSCLFGVNFTGEFCTETHCLHREKALIGQEVRFAKHDFLSPLWSCVEAIWENSGAVSDDCAKIN